MLVEVVVGVIAHSLALLSDAGHMLTDAAAIALSLIAARLATRPAKGAMTYGLKRVEILSAHSATRRRAAGIAGAPRSGERALLLSAQGLFVRSRVRAGGLFVWYG